MLVWALLSFCGQKDRSTMVRPLFGHAPLHRLKPFGGRATISARTADSSPGTDHHWATWTRVGPEKSAVPSPASATDGERVRRVAPGGRVTASSSAMAHLVAAALVL